MSTRQAARRASAAAETAEPAGVVLAGTAATADPGHDHVVTKRQKERRKHQRRPVQVLALGQRQAILNDILQNLKDNPEEEEQLATAEVKRGAFARIAQRHGCCSSTVVRIWKRAQESLRVDGVMTPALKSPQRYDQYDHEELIRAIERLPPEKCTSIRAIAKAIGISQPFARHIIIKYKEQKQEAAAAGMKVKGPEGVRVGLESYTFKRGSPRKYDHEELIRAIERLPPEKRADNRYISEAIGISKSFAWQIMRKYKEQKQEAAAAEMKVKGPKGMHAEEKEQKQRQQEQEGENQPTKHVQANQPTNYMQANNSMRQEPEYNIRATAQDTNNMVHGSLENHEPQEAQNDEGSLTEFDYMENSDESGDEAGYLVNNPAQGEKEVSPADPEWWMHQHRLLHESMYGIPDGPGPSLAL